jgi:hypothetical protein
MVDAERVRPPPNDIRGLIDRFIQLAESIPGEDVTSRLDIDDHAGLKQWCLVMEEILASFLSLAEMVVMLVSENHSSASSQVSARADAFNYNGITIAKLILF